MAQRKVLPRSVYRIKPLSGVVIDDYSNVSRFDGSNQTRLTFNDSVDTGPAWSPDGAHIAFTPVRDGNSRSVKLLFGGAEEERRRWLRNGTLFDSRVVTFLP